MHCAKIIMKFLLLAVCSHAVQAEDKTYSFGVLNQRSITLTAQYWNPILKYVGEKSGTALDLKMGKTAPETSAMIGRGKFDFVYGNVVFTPANAPAGYRVFARPAGEPVQGQIVALEDSPVRTLKDLEGREVGFPSEIAPLAYSMPMDALLRAGIKVTPVFAGNQEGIMGQLKAGRVIAAGVHSEVMRGYAQREGLRYRVLWASGDYLELPVSAHPRVPKEVVRAVGESFLSMAKDPEGIKILAASAALIKQSTPLGFVPAENREYENFIKHFKTTMVKGL